MSYADKRLRAVETVAARKPRKMEFYRAEDGTHRPFDEIFGAFTFNDAAQKKYLSNAIYKKLRRVVDGHERLDRGTADEVAHGMKEWALEHGVTHFCHWFQPLTGSTAEKHDSFLTFAGETAISRFSGGQLVQGEPDASSFPSGGMRSTFEARGYTAWDPSSPAFLMEGPAGLTLTIPCVFVSWHGQVLDKKTPVLRATASLDKAGRDLLALFGKNPHRVFPTAGPEQEYFLIDHAFVAARPDLAIGGRSLVGAEPPKGQQLEDQYFGTIPDRVMSFMQEVDYELYRLGIPAKTRHNEVAPSQFEIAPIFEEGNVAADHNQLLMATMKRVARRHDLVCLFHEKPFAGINGSGKHLNWSIATSDGENLLEPGETPHQNIQFLVTLAATIRGVYLRAGLLRSAIASSANDHRLGANEAPPAIVSVFLGQALSAMVDAVVSAKSVKWGDHQVIDLGVGQIPKLARDTTDRNRTSPFAFTGNKFEFRAVGASQSISTPLAFLTATVSESLADAVVMIKKRMQEGRSLHEAAIDTVTAFIKESAAVRFEGDNYSAEWVKEAEKRGLLNLRTSPEALAQLADAKNKKFLLKSGLMTEEESEALYHVEVERYVKQIRIEAGLLAELAGTFVLPAAGAYLGELGRTAGAVEGVSKEASKSLAEPISRVAEGMSELQGALKALEKKLKALPAHGDLPATARKMQELVVGEMATVRGAVDDLERVVADQYWPLPKYREMLFPV